MFYYKHQFLGILSSILRQYGGYQELEPRNSNTIQKPSQRSAFLPLGSFGEMIHGHNVLMHLTKMLEC